LETNGLVREDRVWRWTTIRGRDSEKLWVWSRAVRCVVARKIMNCVTRLVEMGLFKPFNCERSRQGPGILDDASSGHGREEDRGQTAHIFQNTVHREDLNLAQISNQPL
jgi:hypothetical protein